MSLWAHTAPAVRCSVADAMIAFAQTLASEGVPQEELEALSKHFLAAIRRIAPRRRRVLLAAEARNCHIRPNTARGWARAGSLPKSVLKVGGRWTCFEGDLSRMCMNSPDELLGENHAQVHDDSGRARPERSR